MGDRQKDEEAKAALRQIAMGRPAPPFSLPNPSRSWWQIWKPRRVIFRDITPEHLRVMLALAEDEK